MDALAFIEKPPDAKKLSPIYVLHGDEDFLKRQVVAALRKTVFGDGDEFGLSMQPGDQADFASVRSELETLPFLSPRRLVVINAADPFVTKYRPALEKYFTHPTENGILVLEVKTWASNTKLNKLTPPAGLILCNALAASRLPQWCMKWSSNQYGKELTTPAARLLVDLVGEEMGILDQELAKLAVYVGKASKIDVDDVDCLVDNSREQNVFKILEAAGEGHPREALTMLDRLMEEGQEPLAVLGALSWQLRRLAQAGRLVGQGMPLRSALQRVGYFRPGAEEQLRHLGRRRLNKLYDWMLEANSGMKGGSQLPARTVMERLVVQLARERD
jgi:DNA polymerase-3 subunit delta